MIVVHENTLKETEGIERGLQGELKEMPRTEEFLWGSDTEAENQSQVRDCQGKQAGAVIEGTMGKTWHTQKVVEGCRGMGERYCGKRV